MVRVKICRTTTLEDAEFAVENGADALGFIFYPMASSYIQPEKAAAIVEKLPPFVTSVGVFVDEPPDRVAGIVGTVGLRTVQLHGEEPPEYCRALQGVQIIKAFRVVDGFDIERLADYKVDAVLLDSYDPKLKGGTGRTFNWDVAVHAKRFGRVILSGGLTPENVGEAVAQVNPYGVDVGSGVEAEPGKKDRDKLLAFLWAARSSDLQEHSLRESHRDGNS